MMIEFYASGNVDIDTMGDILLAHETLGNVYPMVSIVYDKKQDRYRKEMGVKITLFDVTPTEMINIWYEMRQRFGIHCIWLDTPDYTGCITHWQCYITHCETLGDTPMTCSEYN